MISKKIIIIITNKNSKQIKKWIKKYETKKKKKRKEKNP